MCSNSHSDVQNLNDFELLDHPVERHAVHHHTRLICLHLQQLDDYIIYQISKLRRKQVRNKIKQDQSHWFMPFPLVLNQEQVFRNVSEDLSMFQLSQKHQQKDAKRIEMFQRALFF